MAVWTVLPRPSSGEPFRSDIVAVEHRHPHAIRHLPASKFHVRKFCQNVAEWSRVAGPPQRGGGASEQDDWSLLAGSEHVVRDLNRFRKPALEHVGVGQKIIGIRISR